jgi:signal transduction histidine kinase
LSILGSESTRLTHLINNVLELAKLDKKQRHFQLKAGDLQDVFSETEAIMAPKIFQEGFELIMEPPQVPRFAYDREVLIQVLINLMENSIKFGKKAQQRRITVKATADSTWVSISVADTGPGIPKHALKKVFEDFYRVDNDLTRTTSGTGIGLALVQKFMVALGGRARAINNQGPGCTLTICLPLASPIQKSHRH